MVQDHWPVGSEPQFVTTLCYSWTQSHGGDSAVDRGWRRCPNRYQGPAWPRPRDYSAIWVVRGSLQAQRGDAVEVRVHARLDLLEPLQDSEERAAFATEAAVLVAAVVSAAAATTQLELDVGEDGDGAAGALQVISKSCTYVLVVN